MREGIQGDLNASSLDFRRVVWPVIRPWCGGGNYQEIESGKEAGPMLILDAVAGVDGLQVLPNGMGVRGIASRLQWGEMAWNTFTVRKGRSNGCVTEMAKRKYAIETPGCLVPYFTCQAYLSSKQQGKLLSCAICYTHQLIPYAEKFGVSRKLHQADGQVIDFAAVDWWQYGQASNFVWFLHTDGQEYATEHVHQWDWQEAI